MDDQNRNAADYQLRIILIGDSTVGKTSMLKYFTIKKPLDPVKDKAYDPTVGVDFFSRILTLEDKTRVKLQVWDTAGQERFRSITKSYYRNTCGVLLVYDISSRSSWEHIPTWMMEARRGIEPHTPTFVLVGAKCDRERQRQVETSEGRQFASAYKMPFFECSSVSGFNIENIFYTVASGAYRRIRTGEYCVGQGWDGVRRGYQHVTFCDEPEEEKSNQSKCC